MPTARPKRSSRLATLVTLLALATAMAMATGCSGNGNGGDSDSEAGGCGDEGSELTGASYSIARSRFAFGSAPVEQSAGGITRWVGAQGVVLIDALGGARGSMNAGAPAASLPDWSGDPVVLTAHVRAYLVGMGVRECQIETTQILGGSAGRTIHLNRGFDTIPVLGSNAYARMNTEDQSTVEGLSWPTIPADVVTAARSLRDTLADPAALAAYQQKLPENARGPGQVVVVHSGLALPGATFRAAAAWSTLAGSSPLTFDAAGARLVIN